MSTMPPRKEEIIGIAARLFAESGFDATSLQDIADAAGIRKASLYTHVSSKHEFLRLIFDVYIDRMLEDAKTVYASEATASEKLQRVIRDLFASIEKYRAHVVVFFEEMRYVETEPFRAILDKRNGYERIIVAILQEGMDSGELRDLDPKIITYLAIGMVQWAYRWYDASGPLDVDAITDLTVDFVLDGLRERPDASRSGGRSGTKKVSAA